MEKTSLRDIWPFLGALALFVCSIDWFVIPFFAFKIESIWIVFLITMPLANLEIRLWYEFWRWFVKCWLPNLEKVREKIDTAEEIKEEITREIKKDPKKRGRLMNKIIDEAHCLFKKANDPENKFYKKAKAFGHFGMLFMGAEPFVPLARVVAVIFCASTGWKSGLYSLYVGNAVHVMISILQWKAGISLWNFLF